MTAPDASGRVQRFLAGLPRYRDSTAVFGVPLYLPAPGLPVVPLLDDGRGWVCRVIADRQTTTPDPQAPVAAQAAAQVDDRPLDRRAVGGHRRVGVPVVWVSNVEVETAVPVDVDHWSLLVRGGFPAGDRRFPQVWQARVHHRLADPLVHRAAGVLARHAAATADPLARALGTPIALDVAGGWSVPVDDTIRGRLLRTVHLLRPTGLARLLDRLHRAGLLVSSLRVGPGGVQPTWRLTLPQRPAPHELQAGLGSGLALGSRLWSGTADRSGRWTG